LAHITIEYMIMVPVLIMQIFLFPLTATVIMDTWVDQRRNLELQEIAGHLGSSIQQLYFTINRASISVGSLSSKLDIPTSIDNYHYTVTFRNATNPSGSTRILNITLNLLKNNVVASTIVTLGENADWTDNSVYYSNSISIINATKTPSVIQLSLVGGST
jgi:hypothetical protein